MIYVKVILLFYSDLPLTYHWDDENIVVKVNDLVYVSVKAMMAWAIVIEITKEAPLFKTKKISALLSVQKSFNVFLKQIVQHYLLPSAIPLYYRASKALVIKKIKIPKKSKKRDENRDENVEKDIILSENSIEIKPEVNKNVVAEALVFSLSDEQQNAIKVIKNEWRNNNKRPFLLQGVTGSGKTCVIIELILSILKENKSVMYLLPDITLAAHITVFIKKYIPSDFLVLSLHTGTTQKEKQLITECILGAIPFVLVGVHIPIFLPIGNVGLYVIDEEHDHGFYEMKKPFMSSKELAIMRATEEKVHIILLSATPSLRSLYYVEEKKYGYFKLQKRYFTTQLPTITKVELNKENMYKDFFWMSKQLMAAITETLENKKQVMLFLNRKGLYSFTQCNNCQYIPQCPNCSVYYTIYEYKIIKCHHCFSSSLLPERCVQCQAKNHLQENKGIGLQQLAKKIEEYFPQARVKLADLENIKSKKEWHETVESMKKGEIDILMGTQLIARGYHFPFVETVGIIWGDMLLSIPSPGITEQIVQNIIQVSGRAGRENLKGNVVVQMISGYHSLDYLSESDYNQFYESEISFCKQFFMPPISKVATIVIQDTNEQALYTLARLIYEKLIIAVERDAVKKSDLEVYEPRKAPLYKINNVFSLFITIKAKQYNFIEYVLQQSLSKSLLARIIYVPSAL